MKSYLSFHFFAMVTIAYNIASLVRVLFKKVNNKYPNCLKKVNNTAYTAITYTA